MKLAELTWPDLEQVSRDLVVVYPIAALTMLAGLNQDTAYRFLPLLYRRGDGTLMRIGARWL